MQGSVYTDGGEHTPAESPSSSSSSSPIPIIDGVLAAILKPKKRRAWTSRMKSKKMSTSSALAERHGVKDDAMMSVLALCQFLADAHYLTSVLALSDPIVLCAISATGE
jgi:hypothetical protein